MQDRNSEILSLNALEVPLLTADHYLSGAVAVDLPKYLPTYLGKYPASPLQCNQTRLATGNNKCPYINLATVLPNSHCCISNYRPILTLHYHFTTASPAHS